MINAELNLELLNKVIKTSTPIIDFQIIDNGKAILYFWKGNSILWFQKRNRISMDEFKKLVKDYVSITPPK